VEIWNEEMSKAKLSKQKFTLRKPVLVDSAEPSMSRFQPPPPDTKPKMTI
jgi:hypothetical protein